MDEEGGKKLGGLRRMLEHLSIQFELLQTKLGGFSRFFVLHRKKCEEPSTSFGKLSKCLEQLSRYLEQLSSLSRHDQPNNPPPWFKMLVSPAIRGSEDKLELMTRTSLLTRTFIPGTPRGFGGPSAGPWIDCVRTGLCKFVPFDPGLRLAVQLEFCIWPGSPHYRGHGREHGTDLDNLIKQTIDALSVTKSQLLPQGLRLIPDDSAIYEIVASKRIVKSDAETGVWIQIWSLGEPSVP